MSTTVNPYLQGNFAPVHEEVTATELPVIGQLPEALNGRYLRNGPNPVSPPEPATYHWFTGDGMVHGIRLRDGRAEWYRNRWVRSAEVARALGEEPRPGRVHAGMDFAANTNVIGHAGRTFAIVEAGARPYELSDELDTIGPCDFGGTLDGGYTAHPKRDPLSGELYAVSYFFGWGDDVEVTILDARGAGALLPARHHGRTGQRARHGHHAALHRPARPPRDLQHGRRRRRRPLPVPLAGRVPRRVGLLPRDGDSTEVVWHDVEPCYVFHPMNAYDQPAGTGSCSTSSRHPSMFRTQLLGPAEGAPTLERWHLDGHGGVVKEERLDDRGQEFPASTSGGSACPTATATRWA